MRLYALTLTLAVFYARAATIPVEVEKTEQVENDKDSNEHPNNVQSNLRNVPEDIPVAIVEDKSPVLNKKIDENSNDYVPTDDEQNNNIKRLEIDLKNPGPPQRQEHENQNPEFFAERDNFVSDIKQKLLDAENIFKKSVSDVNEGFENWIPNSEHLTVIQTDLKRMQTKFLARLSDLNQSLKSYLNPQSTKSVVVDPKSAAKLKDVEIRLKVLETNFNAGVQTLSDGIKTLETAKAEGGDQATVDKPSETGSPSPTPTKPTNEQGSTNPFGQFFQFFSNAVGDAISNVQNSFQSFTNNLNPSGSPSSGTPPAAAQSDEGSSNPNLIEIFQTQFNQFFNPSNQQQFQPIQFFQNIFNQFTKPQGTPATPDSTATKPQENQTPTSSATDTPVQPQAAEPTKQTPAVTQTGPIRQIVQNIPIVKGIVQRIQSFSNPEIQKPAQVTELVKPVESIKEKEPVSATKGHGGGGGGINNGNGTGGANNDSSGIVKNVPIEEKIEEVPQKFEEKDTEEASHKEEKQTVLPDKTE